jgi:hypothetical protein
LSQNDRYDFYFFNGVIIYLCNSSLTTALTTSVKYDCSIGEEVCFILGLDVLTGDKLGGIIFSKTAVAPWLVSVLWFVFVVLRPLLVLAFWSPETAAAAFVSDVRLFFFLRFAFVCFACLPEP